MAGNPLIDRKLRARAVTVVLALAALAASAPGASALPANFWGIVPQANPSAEQFQRLKLGGVDSVRFPVVWASVQPVKGGPLDWSATDALVKGAATAGIDVLPFLTGTPSWAVPVDRRWGSPQYLPVRTAAQKSGWQNFLRQAVLRYGPNGGFWAENPTVPQRPIRTWQVSNEPNFMFFVGRPNPAEYGKLVKLSSTAIKGADRGAKLVLGGLFSNPIQATQKHKPVQAYSAADFLTQMYRRTPGIRSKFQGIALHPYTRTYKRLTPYIEEVRSVLEAYHDAGKGLWITELGWSSKPPEKSNSFAKGPGGQAAQLRGAFRLLKSHQAKWKVQRVYWFSVDDQVGTCNFCDGSGLFGAGFIPKPAWSAYVSFAGGKTG